MPAPQPSRPRRVACALSLTLLWACGPATTAPAHGNPDALAVIQTAAERTLEGQADEATELLAAGLALFPHSYELQLEVAGNALLLRQPERAIVGYEALLAAEPDNAEVAQRLAHACLSEGFLERAADPVARLRSRPDASGADLFYASWLEFERGDLAAAEDWARRALALEPSSAKLAYQLARVLVAEGSSEAQAALERTLELDPGHFKARFALGTLELQAGDEEAGQRQLELRDQIRTLTDAGFAQLPPKRRMALARAAQAALPEWSTPLLERARAQLELGQAQEAQETLAAAESLRPEQLDHAALSYAAARALGQKKRAREWLAKWRRQRAVVAP